MNPYGIHMLHITRDGVASIHVCAMRNSVPRAVKLNAFGTVRASHARGFIGSASPEFRVRAMMVQERMFCCFVGPIDMLR